MAHSTPSSYIPRYSLLGCMGTGVHTWREPRLNCICDRAKSVLALMLLVLVVLPEQRPKGTASLLCQKGIRRKSRMDKIPGQTIGSNQ